MQQQIILRPFLVGILTLKNELLQSAPERSIFMHKIEKKSEEGHPTHSGRGTPPPASTPSAPRPSRLRRSTIAPTPLQNPKYATAFDCNLRILFVQISNVILSTQIS